MCGIATIAIGKASRKNIPYDKLRLLVRILLRELQSRGFDASGIAILNEKGTSESVVFKKPLRSDRFIVRPAFQKMLDKITPDTNFIMLHTRASSIGDTSNNANNHPIIVPGCIGVHNGTLYNHQALFNKFSEDFGQTGDVDSEIIFRLFKHFSDLGESPKNAMRKTAKELYGAFTGAVVDWNHPRRMVMFKNDRPLCVVRIPHYDTIIAISESKFLGKAMLQLKLKPKLICEYAYDGTGLIIDLDAARRITTELNDFDLPIQDMRQHGGNSWFKHYVA